MPVWEKIRKYIDERGIRQAFVAEKCNISATTFNAMMNGKRKIYAEDLRAICLALNVSPEFFLDYKSETQ